jgi:phosphoribosylglycinamide formyltransferase-1
LIGADAVVYLPIEETTQAMGGTPKDFYYVPFGGPHPIRDKQELFKKKKTKIQWEPKICVFISGSGTNLQELIKQTESGSLSAEIVGVISNKRDAQGLQRAMKHNIPAILMEYKKRFKDNAARQIYEEILIKEVKRLKPDLILLSGWTMLLSDHFLSAMQKMEIPVINHHPALLTKNADKTVATSRGTIPVIRGHNSFQEAFDQQLPVSGITIHQVLPGEKFDSGPIIMKAEVRRKIDDTAATFEKRIREMEYITLPSALKRVLHVMNHNNINISKGDFPW